LKQVGLTPSVAVNKSTSTSIQSLAQAIADISASDETIDENSMAEHVSCEFTGKSPAEFESFLSEMTAWMNEQYRQQEDQFARSVADELDHSFEEVKLKFEKSFPISRLPAAIREELRSIFRLKHLVSNREVFEKELKEIITRSVGSIATFLRMLNSVSDEDYRNLTEPLESEQAKVKDGVVEEQSSKTDSAKALELEGLKREKLKVLYTYFVKQFGEPLLATKINMCLTRIMEYIDKELQSSLQHARFAFPILNFDSHAVPMDYFVDYLYRRLSMLNDRNFSLVLKLLQETDQNQMGNLGKASCEKIDDECLAELQNIGTDVFCEFTSICDNASQCSGKAMTLFHSIFRVNIALLDESLVVVSSSDSNMKGTTLKGGVFDKVLNSKKECIGFAIERSPNQVDELCSAIQHNLFSSDEESFLDVKIGHSAVIPILSDSGDCCGVVHADLGQKLSLSKSFTTSSDLDILKEEEINFLRQLVKLISKAISSMERIRKTVTIAESSSSFIREQASATTQFYIVEGALALKVNLREDGEMNPPLQSTCKLLRHSRYTLSPVVRSPASEFVFRSMELGANTSYESALAVPILDNGIVIAVMVVTSLTKGAAIEDDDLDEVKKVAEVLGTALANARTKNPRKRELKAEESDEEGELIFAKFMLDTIRDNISKLDGSAIAELKSYKKPPVSFSPLGGSIYEVL
jgi:hypothetical protein